MSLSDILKKAEEIVQEANLDDRYEVPAFVKTVDVLLSGTAGERSFNDGLRNPKPVAESPLEGHCYRIASKLSLPLEVVAEVWTDMEETAELVVSPNRLEPSAWNATKQLALLVCAGRQGSGQEEWTGVEEVRRVVDDFGRLDSSNFAAAVKSMDDIVQIHGKGQSRQFRLRRNGWERARNLVMELAEANS